MWPDDFMCDTCKLLWVVTSNTFMRIIMRIIMNYEKLLCFKLINKNHIMILCFWNPNELLFPLLQAIIVQNRCWPWSNHAEDLCMTLILQREGGHIRTFTLVAVMTIKVTVTFDTWTLLDTFRSRWSYIIQRYISS